MHFYLLFGLIIEEKDFIGTNPKRKIPLQLIDIFLRRPLLLRREKSCFLITFVDNKLLCNIKPIII